MGMGAAIVTFMRAFFAPMLTLIYKMVKFGAVRKLSAWAALAALIAGLYAAVNALIFGLSLAMPNWLVVSASWVIPSSFDETLTAYLAGTTLIALYRWQREGLLFIGGR